MVCLLLYKSLEVVLVIQDLLEVLLYGGNDSLVLLIPLLVHIVLLLQRFKFA